MLLLNFITKPDIISVTETWLLPSNSLKLLHLDGYNLLSIPRNKGKKRGGGIAFYVNTIYDFKINSLVNLNLANSCEFTTIELSSSSFLNITILNIYKPPDSDAPTFIDSLAEYIDCLKVNKKYVIITGDFNINLYHHDSSSTSNRLLDQLISLGFLPSITLPTRITQTTSTLIDNIFVNQTNRDHFSKIILSDISDHFPTFYSCSLITSPNKSSPPATSFKRIFSSKNFSLCQSLASALNWDQISPYNLYLSNLTPSQSYQIFHSKILFLLNTAFPLVKNICSPAKRTKLLPWISRDIINACRKKTRLLKKFVNNPTVENKLALTRFRNQHKSNIRKAEKQYYYQQFKHCDHNIKATWKVINELIGNDPPSHDLAPTPLCIDNTQFTNPNDIANKFNDYFSNVGVTLANKIPQAPKSYCDYLPAPNPHSFQLRPTSTSEILNLLLELENSSTQGPDNLSSSFIRSIATNIACPLSIIINHSFQHASFPDGLKDAKIIPIHKSGPKTDPSNFRPISLLNIFSKIYEKAINARILDFLSEHSIL